MLKSSPFMEDEEGSEDEAECAYTVIPFEFFAQIDDGENREDTEGDNFLDGFELGGVEFIGADAVGRNLEAVFEEGHAPTGDDDFPQSFTAIFEMTVPGEGHKDVGDEEQSNGTHSGVLQGKKAILVIIR
jgi:hypothetical protein